MSDPFIGEIKLFSFQFAPYGWSLCCGQELLVAQNEALFSVIGYSYGGKGAKFNLPNLQGRALLGAGANRPNGQAFGESDVTLTTEQIPSHSHSVYGVAAKGGSPLPAGHMYADLASATQPRYAAGAADQQIQLAPGTVVNAGGGMPHSNMQPFLVLNYCIAVQGLWPLRS